MKVSLPFPRILLAGIALLLAATACSGGGEDATEAAANPLDEPVTIEHAFGETEIDAVPERVVTIDLQWTDIMLAMGVEPVGYTIDPTSTSEGGMPWQEISEEAEALSLTDGPPIEEIAALEPDLILGMHTIADEETYTLLSEIAPTIANPTDLEVAPWQDLVTIAGQMLNDTDAADEVIASVESEVATAAEELSGLEGQSFALGQYVVGDAIYIVADEIDGSSLFFQDLGMTLYPPVVEEGEETGDPRVVVSTERADLLEADLLAFLVNGGDEDDLADIPGFDELPGTVALLDYETTVGLNTPSPLSVPYALQELRPELEDAAGASDE